MQAASVAQMLYQALVSLFTGGTGRPPGDSEEIPHIDTASERQYFVSRIDDYGDCV